MSCLDPIYNCIQRCMSFRDNNILGLERMFMLLSFAQAIAAITFAIIGGEVFKEKFLHEMGSFKRIHSEI